MRFRQDNNGSWRRSVVIIIIMRMTIPIKTVNVEGQVETWRKVEEENFGEVFKSWIVVE